MANVLLGVTGSVAALKTPELMRALLAAGYQVKVVATQPALYFFDHKQLPPGILVADEDEWPRQHEGKIWQRSDPVLHIELRRWADLLLIAPLDANTLAKLAIGISDNCLTCVCRAWDLSRPVLLAPAMNTLMWEHPQTVRHLQSIAQIYQVMPEPALTASELVCWINAKKLRTLRITGPIEKLLACGDTGQGGMAEVEQIVDEVAALLAGVA